MSDGRAIASNVRRSLTIVLQGGLLLAQASLSPGFFRCTTFLGTGGCPMVVLVPSSRFFFSFPLSVGFFLLAL